MDRPLHLSTALLLLIGALDLISTLVLMKLGMREANPLFARILQTGIPNFVAAKVFFLACPILVLEYVRTKKPRSAEQGTWIAVLAYLVLYLTHISKLMR